MKLSLVQEILGAKFFVKIDILIKDVRVLSPVA